MKTGVTTWLTNSGVKKQHVKYLRSRGGENVAIGSLVCYYVAGSTNVSEERIYSMLDHMVLKARKLQTTSLTGFIWPFLVNLATNLPFSLKCGKCIDQLGDY